MGFLTFFSFCNYLHLNNLVIEHPLSVSYFIYSLYVFDLYSDPKFPFYLGDFLTVCRI